MLTDLIQEAREALDEKKIKSNDPMPPRTQANVEGMMALIREWRSPHRAAALRFAEEIEPRELFTLLHSMRRWYSGQTMMRKIKSYRPYLVKAMDLDPDDVVGVYRGFHVDRDDPIAAKEAGDRFDLPVTRNRGFSSWSLTEEPTHRFSGSSKDKAGIIVRLIDAAGLVPVLAPPQRTRAWFNALYALVIGNSFRPKEEEYLISGSPARVEVVQIKR
jgi:hypothetical protein